MVHKKRFGIIFTIAITATVLVATYFWLPKFAADQVYPLQYSDLIVKYSSKYNVDPALVAAVIFQESRFNPKSVSGAGAQGIMQFMPGTASTMAKETGRWPKYDIFDPETSIEFGAAHLRDLLNKYNGNTDQALASYNAGTGTVDSWISSHIFDRLVKNSTTGAIGYAKRVERYRDIYASMYPQELGLVVNAQLLIMPKAATDAQVRGFVWSQVFSSVFSLGSK